ncbi:MAG: TonB-dependent receptor [Bryobacteraceae bacterium]|nr:TonB-dependent receptor [Bryobacteraceae bacterium]
MTPRFLALSFLFVGTVAAQTSLGTVSGLVLDPSGSAVPAATIELTNVQQNTVRTAQSNASGSYRFDAVNPGNYKLKVAQPGFATFETSEFPVAAAQVITLDARLEVSTQASTISVVAETVQLQAEAPVRQASISAIQSTQLPIANRNPALLALTLPGVSTNRGGTGVATFSVNGGRGRSNNFLLDGTENNDISVAGQAFQITNPDAVQEVSIQTSNFDAEFGRAGGAVVNTIIRSGTNDFRGSLGYLIESTRFNAITRQESLNTTVQQRGRPLPGTDQWFSGTLGGPIVKDRTFFFGAYQERRQNSVSSTTLTTLSAPGKQTLRNLFPEGRNQNVDRYLSATQGVDANSQFTNIDLGSGRGVVQAGTFVRGYAQTFRSSQPVVKIDHRFNDRNLLMGRMALDDQVAPVGGTVNFIGLDTGQTNRYQNYLISYTRIFSSTVTNELRLPYNRIKLFFPNDATSPLAQTLPQITIAGLTAVGVASNIPQGRIANNYGIQDTVSIVRGRHSFRVGLDLLEQRAKQAAPFNVRGTLGYAASTGFTGLANFIDDFGGSGGAAGRDFGSPDYYPNLFRQAYFAQDRWRATDSLTLTLGVRYEYFGLPMNSLRTPAYTGLFNVDPRTFTGPFSQPNRVAADKNNWSPTVGLAWSPSYKGGLRGWLMGDRKFVFRAGYQIGYDSFFNNIASNAAASSPNLVATSEPSVVDAANPRGAANHSTRFPSVARALLPTDAQTLMNANLVNPYIQRWSGGFQRTTKGNVLLDISYVASKGTRLYINEDGNPLVPVNFRILPSGVGTIPYTTQGRYDNLQGSRLVRTNGGSSTYHSFQADARRRFSSGLTFAANYTWAKFIDNGADVFAWGTFASPQQSAIPAIFGGLPNEKALSSLHRAHRATISWVYDLPWMKSQRGFLGRVVGGWQISGIGTFETGVPYTVSNGLDADGFGGNFDRPDYNPNGRPGTRAIVSATSPTGYIDLDNNNAPIAAADAMYIQLPACNVTANPNGCRTGNLGRNTLVAPGIANWNVNFSKMTNITERVRTELRVETFNLFNHPQLGTPASGAFSPGTPALGSNVGTTLAGRFLNANFMDGGGRVMRFGLRLLF